MAVHQRWVTLACEIALNIPYPDIDSLQAIENPYSGPHEWVSQ
jgi:hypothetical protein